MCGRYSFVPTKKQLDEQLQTLELPAPLQLKFNIAPTQRAYVIANDKMQAIQQMTWGLVPYWSKDGSNSGKLINARAESIMEKPSFRTPAIQRHCLVPADSFYEWRTLPGKRKIPYRIFLKNKELLFMAGIWDEWREGHVSHRTFSVITTTPNAEMATLHNRMPVLLTDSVSQQRWLECSDPEAIKAILKTPVDDILEMYRVSERLNTAGYEGSELHDQVNEVYPPTLF